MNQTWPKTNYAGLSMQIYDRTRPGALSLSDTFATAFEGRAADFCPALIPHTHKKPLPLWCFRAWAILIMDLALTCYHSCTHDTCISAWKAKDKRGKLQGN